MICPLGRRLPRLDNRRLPAVEQRQHTILVLAGAPGDLAGKPAFAEVAAGDAFGKLLQVLVDLLDAPVAAEVMADDSVESVAAVSVARAFAHDSLDVLDAVAGAVEPVAVDLCCGRFC